MTNLSNKLVIPYKHICNAVPAGLQEWIVEPELNDKFKMAKELSTLNYKKAENQQGQIECHIELEHNDAKWNGHVEKDVKVDPEFDGHRNKAINIMP